ncbi:NAD(+) diphosphatase [Halomonas denitrificans]|nr:NAD(+) diphosphatase [Halomonas denitrificans]
MSERDTHIVLPYAGLRLKRTSPLRDRDDWREVALGHPGMRLLPVWRGRNLVTADDGTTLRSVSAPHVHAHAAELILLGEIDDAPILAADLSSLHEEQAFDLAGDARFHDLRRIGPSLEPQDAALLSYARGMAHWHVTHRHCGRCGTEAENRKAGMQRSCSNGDCGGVSFPRIDPAIIVLVEDGGLHGDGVPRCLLGRAPGWPDGVYSTLAGFVEPGESLEEAVAREVREESNIGVRDVRYRASQPWPFPSSLMLGFRATARTLEIVRHDKELEDARWFTPDALREAGTWGDDSPVCLPRRDSIARFLIEDWLAEQD